MRVTIEPEGMEPIILIDGSGNNAWSVDGALCVLDPEPDGLEGWREAPSPKFDSAPEISDQDGAFWPERVFLRSRILTIRGSYSAGWLPGSSELASARFRDRLAALTGVPLTITVADQSGPRTVTGFIGAQGVSTREDDLTTLFSIVVTCPDPLKYGPAANYPAGSGLLTVENVGTGNVAPIITALGHVTTVRVALGQDVVEWHGDSQGLVLDIAEGVPRNLAGEETGVMVWADPLRVPPGVHEITATSDAELTLTVRSGWK